MLRILSSLPIWQHGLTSVILLVQVLVDPMCRLGLIPGQGHKGSLFSRGLSACSAFPWDAHPVPLHGSFCIGEFPLQGSFYAIGWTANCLHPTADNVMQKSFPINGKLFPMILQIDASPTHTHTHRFSIGLFQAIRGCCRAQPFSQRAVPPTQPLVLLFKSRQSRDISRLPSVHTAQFLAPMVSAVVSYLNRHWNLTRTPPTPLSGIRFTLTGAPRPAWTSLPHPVMSLACIQTQATDFSSKWKLWMGPDARQMGHHQI